MNRYPITRVALANALGTSLPEITRRVVAGETGLSTSEQNLRLRAIVGRYSDELPELPETQARISSRTNRLLLVACRQVAADVARVVERFGARRVAVVLGSSSGGIDASEHAFERLMRTGELPENYSFFGQHTLDSLTRLVSALFGASGPSYVVSTACSSSGKALAAAQRLLEADFADAVLAGGADALSQLTLRGFHSLGILSAERCRPFDELATGINLGEGSAVFLIERETPARFYLGGAGESADAHHLTAPDPEGAGAVLAMRRALRSTGLEAPQVDYVSAHGTGTRLNDLAESSAIGEIFGSSVPVSSTKDRTGHLLGTAGAMEVALCLGFCEIGELPGNPASKPGNAHSRIHVLRQPVRKKTSVVLKNSFGFGGSNVSLVLTTERGEPRARRPKCPVIVRAAAFWAPGYPSFDALLRGACERTEPPAALLLPERARARASVLTRLFAELCGQLGDESKSEVGTPRAGRTRLPNLATVPTVYGSAYGEMATTVALLEMLWDESGELSPARFQSSVHNHGASVISIATKNRAFSTTLAAGPDTFAMGLVEATAWLGVHGGEVLLLVADEQAPQRLVSSARHDALGIGLYLAADWTSGGLAELTGILRDDRMVGEGDRPFPGLPERFRKNPAAAGLGLLRALSRGVSGPERVALTSGVVSRHTLEITSREGG